MSSQIRFYKFQGTDAEYILYLESLLKSHQCLEAHPRPLSPPASEGLNEASTPSDGEAAPTLGKRTLIFEPYIPQLCPPVRPIKKSRTERPRWMNEIDDMLKKIPSDWSERRKEIGLSTSTEILNAFDLIISSVESPTTPSTVGEAQQTYCNAVDVTALLSTYVADTAKLLVRKEFTQQIYHFRVLIQVSLCRVMLVCGVDKTIIDSILQQHVSQSTGRNLDRLMLGAHWINQMIDVLREDGFGHSAGELFVLWGVSIAKYGRFAAAGQEAFDYFRRNVPEPAPEIQTSVPFLVPFIIKTIVGSLYSLENICSSLGYRGALPDDEYEGYFRNYQERQVDLHEHTITAAPSAGDSSHYREGGWEAGGSPSALNVLLLAAEHSDTLSGSATHQQLSLRSSTNALGSPLTVVTGINPVAETPILNSSEWRREDWGWDKCYDEDHEWQVFYNKDSGVKDVSPSSHSEEES